ncbi:MAG: 2-nitropropane dioxygenase [Legionellales bacterium]|nr:2-nitropropane dioxygenase [Legionellales bacterium]|tara:strand:- start:11556 stop:12563 length:1008 start_codon:yes stop_codon:yes gene_type:complete
MKKLHTPLCELLSLDIPIFQAPMGGTVTPEFASAVANHGGLGMLPLGNYALETCEQMIDDTLGLTGKAIGVNLILEWDQRERLTLSLNKGIKTIWFFWGDPSPYIDEIHAHGAKVILTVGSAEEAKRAVDNGVDIIVTQGWEAGGHVWGDVATLPLVPAVVDAVGNKVPVVAAGGIADGRGMAATLALGAQGVVLGTRLLTSVEAAVHQQYKDRIINAKETDTVYTDLFDKGWPNSHMRVLRNSSYQQWLDAGKPPSGNRPGEHDVITEFNPDSPVERYSYYLPAPAMKGDLEPLANYMGQSAGLVKNIQPVTDIIDEVIDGAIQQINAINNSIV